MVGPVPARSPRLRLSPLYFVLSLAASVGASCGHEPAAGASDKLSPSGALVNVNLRSLCSATLIAPKVLLTAAHCLSNGEGGPLNVQEHFTYFTLSREAYVPDDEISAVVLHYVVHPGYVDAVPVVEAVGPHRQHLQDYVVSALKTECGTLVDEASNEQSPWFSGNLTEQMMRDEEAYVACQTNFLRDLLGPPRSGSDALLDTHDIALVFLDRAIPNVQPARLPNYGYEPTAPGTSVTVASYGTRYDPIEKVDVFGLQRPGELNVNTSSLFEMEVGGSDRVLCPGDSGGGLFVARGDSSLEVVGVSVRTLLMPLSRRCTGPSSATRVGPYVAWIEREWSWGQ